MEPAGKYGHLAIFQRPCCWIGTGRGNTLQIDRHISQEIQCIEEELVVVAIAGPCRTGKSYLLNRLAGQNRGFPLGSTIESATKGMWVWCLRHPKEKDKVMLLLDTEGLGDIKKGNPEHDVWILSLTLLLCSTLVYNVLAVLSQDIVEKLDLVAEVAKKLPDKTFSNVSTFPDLILSLRDFTLDLSIDNREVSPDEYFEHSLELRPDHGTDENFKAYNDQRKRIKKGFPRRKCFIFERPARKNVLKRLSEVKDDELDNDFVQQSNTFCNFIFDNSPVKLIDVDIPARGRNLCDIAESYVHRILQGDLPNFYDTLQALYIKECQRAADDSIAMYLGIMGTSVEIPTHSLEIIHAAHDLCLEEVLAIFGGMAMKGENGDFMKKIEISLREELEHIIQNNKEESIRKSHKLLQELYAPIAKKLLAGEYNRMSGYSEYINDRLKMRESYREYEHVLGFKASDVFEEFEKEKQKESEMLEQLDIHMTEHALRMEDLKKKLSQINKQTQLQMHVNQEDQMRMQERREDFQRHLREMEENHKAELQKTHQALQKVCCESLSRQRDQLKLEQERLHLAERRQLRLHISWQRQFTASEVPEDFEKRKPNRVRNATTEPADSIAEEELRRILSSDKDEMDQRKEEIVDILFQNFNRHTFAVFLSQVKSDEMLEYVFSHILKTKHRDALCMTLRNIQEEWSKRFNDSNLVLWIGSDYVFKEGQLTFVCYHMKDVISKVSFYLGLPVVYRHYHKIEREPLEVRIHQKYQHMSLSETDASLIEQLIHCHGVELFSKHSNLEAISASSVISSKTRGLVEETAIVLYCRLKGVIPFAEPFFPSELRIEDRVFSTDVREGFFSFGMMTPPPYAERPSPRNYNNPLKNGCSVGSYNSTLAGTLGPFVKFADGRKGFLTCAHVFGVTCINSKNQVFAVQPATGEAGNQRGKDDRLCGLLERVVFDINRETSIDAALVQIDPNKRDIDPIGFVWDHSNELLGAGFSEMHPPSFQNGTVIPELDFRTAVGNRVIKCGRSTGLTKGSFTLKGPAIRIHDALLNLPTGIIMNNQTSHIMRGQYIVEGSGNEPFFKGGDSGSGVYLVNSNNALALVGLAIGSLTPGECVVTPIGPVLTALGLNRDSVMKEDDMEMSGLNTDSVMKEDDMEMSDLTSEQLLETESSSVADPLDLQKGHLY